MKYINEIFDLLLDDETYSKYGITCSAKYWKMGTSYFTMFDRLYENIKNLDISKPMKCVFNEKNKTTQGKNKSYKFLIDEINVTPCKVRGYVSDSAIHQYMRSITSFGLGVVEKKYDNNKEFVEKNGEIRLVSNVKELLKKENRLNLIRKIIGESFFSNVQDTRNIAYSIIMEFLFAKNFDFNLLIDKNRIFYWNKLIGKLNKKEIKCASLVTDLDKIKKDIYNQGTIATFKEVIDCLKNEYDTVEKFIEDIWWEYQYKLNNNDNFYDDLIQQQIMKYNLQAQIVNNRSKFKDNIFNNRKQKGLINKKDELYTDIVDLNNSKENLLAKFNECEAAHIYDVYKIKRKIFTNNDQKIILDISNPNNGLIMKHEYHKSFDRGQWFFDANGNMIVPLENQEYLFNILNLKRIKINPLVLNDKMKQFLAKR